MATNIFSPLPSPVTRNGCGFRAEASGTATGIGDVVVRTKYSLLQRHAGGLAAGRLSPHVNAGYTVSGASDAVGPADSVLIAPPDEVNYAGGADVAVSLRTTVALDVVGRTLRKVGTPSWRHLHLLLGSVGIKLNPVANLLVSTNILFPLSTRGLTDNLTWLAGFDYSF